MFVFFSKFIPPLLYPLGLAILLLIAALALRKWPTPQGGASPRRGAWLHTAAISIALAILLIASNRWVALGLARSLEWRYLPQGEVPTTEVIVLLGGGTDPAAPPRQSVEINSAGDRVLYAARLYKEGKAPVILASGGSITWLSDRPSSPATEMAEILAFVGVPEEDIWLQPDSQNTYEDALYSAEMLRERGIQQVILVTSAMHMPRSVGLFEKQGIQVIPAPTDFTVTEDGWAQLTQGSILGRLVYLLPSSSNLNITTNVLKEYLGMLAYSLRGWM